MSKNFSAFELSVASQTVTIANTAQQSSIINCFGGTPLKLFIPAAFTTCDITYLCSNDGLTFSNALKDMDGTAITTAGVVAGDCINLDAAVIAGVQYLQLNCSNPQGAARTITITGGGVINANEIG